MSDHSISPPLKKPLRELCPECRERPARDETGICERCELNALADILQEGLEGER